MLQDQDQFGSLVHGFCDRGVLKLAHRSSGELLLVASLSRHAPWPDPRVAVHLQRFQMGLSQFELQVLPSNEDDIVIPGELDHVLREVMIGDENMEMKKGILCLLKEICNVTCC